MKDKLKILLACFWILFLFGSCENKIATLKSIGIHEDSLKIATQKLHNYVDEGRLPGTFVRIIKEGKVVYNDLYGLTGTVNIKSGEYSWGGAAKTLFWINPTHYMIVICIHSYFLNPLNMPKNLRLLLIGQ